jgi:hypothetical protein
MVYPSTFLLPSKSQINMLIDETEATYKSHFRYSPSDPGGLPRSLRPAWGSTVSLPWIHAPVCQLNSEMKHQLLNFATIKFFLVLYHKMLPGWPDGRQRFETIDSRTSIACIEKRISSNSMSKQTRCAGCTVAFFGVSALLRKRGPLWFQDLLNERAQLT